MRAWIGWTGSIVAASGLACAPDLTGLGTTGQGTTEANETSTTSGLGATETGVPPATDDGPPPGDTTDAPPGTDDTTTEPPSDTTDGTTGEPFAFYRREVIIDADMVPGIEPLLDFTVAVTYVGDEGLRDVANGGHVLDPGAEDIVFRDADGQPLAKEVVSYGPTTGRMFMWVRVTEVSPSEDTVIYLDYGAEPLLGLSPTQAWDDDYVGVWHFDDVVAPGGPILDSSANGNDGIATNMTMGNGVAGRVGGGLSFTQVNAAVRVGGSVLDLPGPVTFEGWGRMDGPLPMDGYQRLFNKGGEFIRPLTFWVGDTSTTIGEVVIGVNYEQPLDFVELVHTIPAFGYGQWHHYAGVVDTTADEVRLYVDGVEVGSTPFADPIETGHPDTYFGNWDDAGSSRRWNGVLDEFRFSDTVRSQAWIEAGFRNQEAPQSTVSIGPEMMVP